MSKTSKQAGERTQKEELKQFDEGVKLAGRNLRFAILIENGKEIFKGHPADMPVRFVDVESGEIIETNMQNVSDSGTPINDQGEEFNVFNEEKA